MSVIKLTALEGDGTPADRTYDLTFEICELIREKGIGMTVANIVGCLEMAKMTIVQENEE